MTPLRHPPVFSEPIYGTETTGAELAGWVRVPVTLGGEEVFRGWLDRPYEEYHLWPDAAAASPHEDPPGRGGKRRNRVSLSAAAWPGLSAWTREPWLKLSAVAG